MNGKIFVNYRRDDSAANALSIAQFLEREFGEDNVFLDIDRMRAGQDFPSVLKDKLKQCQVLIAIIGPAWLSVRNEQDQRRLDDPEDWVRLEIVQALERKITVIPVLVGGASLPRKSEIPVELHPLLQRQAVSVTANGFRYEMAGLAHDVRAIIGYHPLRRPWVWALAAVLAIGTALALNTFVLERSSRPLVASDRDAAVGVEPGGAFRDCVECPEMVIVPGGSFVIGSPSSERGRDVDEEPMASIVLKDFAIGKLEVTRAEWQHCVSEEACSAKPEPAQTVLPNLPISSISWQDASEYARWLSSVTKRKYRLPSESEWEYAARAGNDAPRFWGFSPSEACLYANVGDRSYEQATRNEMATADQAQRRKLELGGVHKCSDQHAAIAPAGSFKPNRFGLHDMLGNLWEWVEDCTYPNYQPLPPDGKPYVERDCRVGSLRGGSYVSGPASTRSANRFQGGRNLNQAQPDFGFRVARELTR